MMTDTLLAMPELHVVLPVAVVADDPAWLDSLVELFRACDLAAIGFDAFDGLPALRPGVGGFGCLVVAMPAHRIELGLAVLRSRSEGEAGLPAILLVPGPIEPALALAVLRAGAWDLVDVAGSEQTLPGLVRRAMAGERPDGASASAASLAPDERRLLEMLLAGRSRRTIGRRFGLDHAMIDARWIAAGRRLGARGHLGAVRAAMDAGIRPG